MAVDADAVALDAAQGAREMTAGRNAAIWYAPDGYDPKKGLNGRRMMGESLLRGWFRHAEVEEWVALTHGPTDAQAFSARAAEYGPGKPVRTVRLDAAHGIAPVGTVFFSGPNYAVETWRRAVYGATAYGICGLTHTISTKAVMEGAWHLRASPQVEWDAVICTSTAARAAVTMQMDLIDAFLAERFGGPLPPRPQFPVIPLGVDCDAFAPDPAAGVALRRELGIGEGDAVALVVARLSPHEKFDPLPVWIALQQAQAGASRRLHLILFGAFPDDYSKRVFLDTAPVLMPDVRLHHLGGGDDRRRAALSAAEMFLFPIDNLQETFGLAPVEAMAAGLPVVASDWDGIRDTVDGGAGIRVPTVAARPEHVTMTGLRHQGGTDAYTQYLGQISAVTAIDVRAMAAAVRQLIDDAALRQRMGAAAKARARALYDWGVVVPQMQDLFAELDARRRAADPAAHPPMPAGLLPVAPSPMAYFASFPTELLPEGVVHRWVGGTVPVGRAFDMRDYAATRRLFEKREDVERVADALRAAGQATAAALARETGFGVLKVERCLLWLVKYGFAAAEG